MELNTIIGLKVVAIKGIRTDRKKRHFYPEYILFDDKKTYITLEDQDYNSFHDCSTVAKEIDVFQDKEYWNLMMTDNNLYPDADMDI